MARMTLEIIGEKPFREQLAAITKRLTGDEMGKVYLAAAGEVRDEARQQAPMSTGDVFGKSLGISQVKKPGTLKRSIVAFKSRAGNTPAAWARVNIFKGAVRAPHAHLVEFGTKAHGPKNGRFMAFIGRGGHLVFAKRVKGAKANPFFARALSSVGQRAIDRAATKAKQLVEKRLA